MICLLSALNGYADASTLLIPKAAKPPELDGQVKDEEWASGAKSGAFMLVGGSTNAATERTEAFVMRDDANLYVGFRCHESQIKKLKATINKRNGNIWEDDDVEFFIATGETTVDYRQFMANSIGARWDDLSGKEGDWTAKAFVGSNVWSVEMAIPFAWLGIKAEDGMIFRGHFCRGEKVKGENSAWPEIGGDGGFHNLQNSAWIVFGSYQALALRELEGLIKKIKGLTVADALAGDKSGLLKELRELAKEVKGKADLSLKELRETGMKAAGINDRITGLEAKTYPERFGGTSVSDTAYLISETSQLPALWSTQKFLVKDVCIDVQARDASAKLVINGENVALTPGKPLSVRISEGLNVIGVDAQAQGPNPGVKARVAGDPWTDMRWRVSTNENPAWTGRSFDDNGWPMAVSDAQNFMWATNGTQRIILRQVVLWNRGHDGPDRCIHPLIKEWGISEGAMENPCLMLYSHFPFALENYEFILDVPTEFRLLDIMHKERGDRRWNNNVHVCPEGIAVEATEHGGRPYTSYRISELKTNVGPDRITGQLLPLFLEKWSGVERSTAWYYRLFRKWRANNGGKAERSTVWYYRRVAKGNFTELEQKIPVRILPPINGRLLKKIMISQFCAEPWGSARLSPEHYEQHMRQSFQAGFNVWIFNDLQPTNTADRVLKAGGRIILCASYPWYGLGVGVDNLGHRWLNDHPSARARYFEDCTSWEERGQYCPSYVINEGRADFLALVKKTDADRLLSRRLSGASIIWSDWEETPWVIRGRWCFCDRCKAEFRKFANLPADADLSDAAIFKNYKEQWKTFRFGLDGKVAGIVKQAANELGKSYMLYAGGNLSENLWPAMKGNIDLAFSYPPGGDTATVSYQKPLDDFMAMFRDKVGLNRSQTMAQEFAGSSVDYMFCGTNRPLERLKENKIYDDPKLQKRGILRCIAARGLGVDLCTSVERSGGMLYWIGEATRILAEYEDLFHDGERDDNLAACDKLDYPNVLVLKRGDERLVLLFNEGEKPLTVILRNKDVKSGQTAAVFGTDIRTNKPAEMTVTVPDQDVVVVHIR